MLNLLRKLFSIPELCEVHEKRLGEGCLVCVAYARGYKDGVVFGTANGFDKAKKRFDRRSVNRV